MRMRKSRRLWALMGLGGLLCDDAYGGSEREGGGVGVALRCPALASRRGSKSLICIKMGGEY